MRTKWIVMAILLVAILLVAGGPVISVIIASLIAQSHGCTLHEGFVNPCVVNGEDIGHTLYTMSVMGWYMLLTLPVGLVALAVWVGVAIALFHGGNRRPTPPAA